MLNALDQVSLIVLEFVVEFGLMTIGSASRPLSLLRLPLACLAVLSHPVVNG